MDSGKLKQSMESATTLSVAPLAVVFDRAEAEARGWPWLERFFCIGVIWDRESFAGAMGLSRLTATAAEAEHERATAHIQHFPSATVQRAYLLFDPASAEAMTFYEELSAEGVKAREALQ